MGVLLDGSQEKDEFLKLLFCVDMMICILYELHTLGSGAPHRGYGLLALYAHRQLTHSVHRITGIGSHVVP